jgi:hypothetical protein
VGVIHRYLHDAWDAHRSGDVRLEEDEIEVAYGRA